MKCAWKKIALLLWVIFCRTKSDVRGRADDYSLDFRQTLADSVGKESPDD